MASDFTRRPCGSLFRQCDRQHAYRANRLAEGRILLRQSRLLGFVEGTSKGRTSARFANDPPSLFNLWRRQDFDQPPHTEEDGGRVWEHWCAQRDIRATHAIGTSVLTAFVALVAALGDLFIPTVARGRKEYGHPAQLRAMIRAGLVDRASAVWEGTPSAIPSNGEALLEEADPTTFLEGGGSFRLVAPSALPHVHAKDCGLEHRRRR